MGDAAVLELVDEQMGEALRDLAGDIRALGEQAAEDHDDVARRRGFRPRAGCDREGVELGELELAPGALALGGGGGAALLRDRPLAKPLGGDVLGLERVDPAHEARQQPGRVAADLVTAQRQLVEMIEQDREPVRGADDGEERIEARVGRVVAQQALGDLLVGADPKLLARQRQELLDPAPQPRPRSSRSGQDEDPLGPLATGGQRDQALGQRLRAPAPGDASHQHRPVARGRRPRAGLR